MANSLLWAKPKTKIWIITKDEHGCPLGHIDLKAGEWVELDARMVDSLTAADYDLEISEEDPNERTG